MRTTTALIGDITTDVIGNVYGCRSTIEDNLNGVVLDSTHCECSCQAGKDACKKLSHDLSFLLKWL